MPESIQLLTALEVGRRRAEAIPILFRVRLSNEKIRQSAALRPLNAPLESAQPIYETYQL
jgi:hypothetical protein